MGLFGFGKKKDPDKMSVEELLTAARKFADKGNKEMYFSYTVRAAERGHVASMELAAMLYRNKNYGIPDREESFKWTLKAAQAGSVSSMLDCGEYWKEAGKFDEAIAWYKKAVDSRDEEYMGMAAEAISGIYYVKLKDRAKGFQWLQKAAEYGDADSIMDLAVCYYCGRDVARDIKKAYENTQRYADYMEGYMGGEIPTESLPPKETYMLLLDEKYKFESSGNADAVRLIGEYMDILDKQSE